MSFRAQPPSRWLAVVVQLVAQQDNTLFLGLDDEQRLLLAALEGVALARDSAKKPLPVATLNDIEPILKWPAATSVEVQYSAPDAKRIDLASSLRHLRTPMTKRPALSS